MPPRRTRASTASTASSSKARSAQAAASAQDSSEEETKPIIRASSSRKKKAAPVIQESEEESEAEAEPLAPFRPTSAAAESEKEQSSDEQNDEIVAPSSGQRKQAELIVRRQADSSSDLQSEEEDEEAQTPPPASPSHANAAEPAVADAEDGDTPTTPSVPEEPIYMPPKAKEPEKPRDRLVIHKIVLVNFKSYAGRVEIGPFHTSFSAIVGPNGSGKSNTIDALLFVFGYRASKMRQGKLSELIHNSEGKMDLDFCAVEVHFREIIDLPGDGNHSVVPGSSLVVSRQAFRDNKSKYTINSRNSNYTEVVTLLKDKGIDLDHKRFLILQGEVESIAQMKPKGATEHEDGLLEYLEDIIGTSDYKEPIEKALEDVDRLNEERGEKLARVKLVEREKKNLESRKKEADEYLKNLNDKAILDSKICQHHRLVTKRNIAQVSNDLTEAQTDLETEQKKNAGIKKDYDGHQTMYTEAEAALKDIETETKALEKELAVFDKKEVQLSEQKKHFSARQKKLSKTLSDDSHAKSEAANTSRDSKSSVEKFTKEISKLEKELESEELELDKIRDSLKGKTEGISAQIEVKQAELQPWAAKVSEKQAARSVAVSERDLLQERVTSVERAIEEAETSIAKFKQTASTSQSELSDLKQEKRTAEKDLANAQTKLDAIKGKNANLRKSASSARQKVDEAKASQLATKSQSKVLSDLTKLKDQGRLSGFHGRLGDLGSIDSKYDVAISTACPGLNNLVCDTVEDGQACLEHLRRSRSGRAVIICLTALQKYNLEPVSTPEGVPRLFDLVKTKDDKYRPALYQLLRDTLVAKDLEQANRIAYGQRRYRVVTVSGELIDTSGTMSGGGSRPSKGLMGAKISADEYSPEQVARFEREYEKADGDLRNLADDQSTLEAEISRLQKRPLELSTAITKAEMTMKSANQRAQDTQRRIEELRAQAQPEAGDLDRITSLEVEIAKADKEIAKLASRTDAIEAEIQTLQDQILAIGGTKLRVQQGKVQDLKERIDHAADRLTKSEVAGAKADKDILKLDKAIELNSAAVAEADEQLDLLNQQIKDNSRAAETIRASTEEARELVASKREELAELKGDLDHKLAAIQKFRTAEAKLEQVLKKLEADSTREAKNLNHWNAKLAEIELQEIDDDDDDDDAPAANEGEEEDRPSAREPVELREYSEEELDEMDVEALKAILITVEELIERAKPNLEVLKEYQARERQFMERAKEFDEVTAQRDTAKQLYESLRKERLEKFMGGFSQISLKLKEMYQMITLGGNAELELVDSLDPFSEGIVFSVMPPKKSWKHISNLSGGEKTLSSLALVFALHVFKPTPLYFMDEIDAALDFRNVSIVANYISQRTKNAQFIIISLRNNMFELASRLVGIYKTSNCTKSITIDNAELAEAQAAAAA